MGKCQRVWLDPADFTEKTCGKDTELQQQAPDGTMIFCCENCSSHYRKYVEFIGRDSMGKLREENRVLALEKRSLERRMEEERHEFERKQIGMSHLVTVLMDARFGEGGEVYIGVNEFVSLGSEAAALRKDNQRLQNQLDTARERLSKMEAEKLAHKMALQEATGMKIADLVHERDELKKQLELVNNADTEES